MIPQIFQSFFGSSSKVLVPSELYGNSKLGRELRDLTTHTETSQVTIKEAGRKHNETRIDEHTLTRQVPITSESCFDANGNPSDLLLLALGVPRITMKLPNGQGVVPVGGGSCARIGKGIFLGANHVNSMGIGSFDRNPVPGTDILKEIRDLTNKGAEIWIDFPVPAGQTTMFSKPKADEDKGDWCFHKKDNGFIEPEELNIISAQAVILGEDPKNDLAVLGLVDPNQDITFPDVPKDLMPLIKLSAEDPEAGSLVAKVGHAGCAEQTLVSVGEVLVPELTEEQIARIVDQSDRLDMGLSNMFGNLKREDDPKRLLLSLVKSPKSQLRAFQGKRVTNALAQPGDSGGILIDPATGELKGTTVLTLSPFLNNRIAAGVIGGYFLGVQPKHIPIDHLSAHTNTRAAIELLDKTLGRQNLNKLLDRNGEEVVVTENEARRNTNMHTATFALREAVTAELTDGSNGKTPSQKKVDQEIKTRHNLTPEPPLDFNGLKERVAKSRPEEPTDTSPDASTPDGVDMLKIGLLSRAQADPGLILGEHKFSNIPVKVTKLAFKANSDQSAIVFNAEFETAGGKIETPPPIEIHPSVLTTEGSSKIVDDYTRSLIEDYFTANPGQAVKLQTLALEVLSAHPGAPIPPKPPVTAA